MSQSLSPSPTGSIARRRHPLAPDRVLASCWSPGIARALLEELRHAPASPAASPCASVDDVMAFTCGRLTTEQLVRFDAHLGACATCSGWVLETLRSGGASWTTAPAPRKAGRATARRPRAASVLEPGMRIASRFTILGLLGRGGMGEVYEAFDHLLEQPVAIKTILVTESDSGTAMARLAREVQIGRKVNHPNVCRVHDVGVEGAWGDLSCSLGFLTMELIAGETLGSRLRRSGPLDPAETRAVLRAALSGLGALHAAGVVHRDVKSDNVMLRARRPLDAATLIDLGLAREHGERVAPRPGPLPDIFAIGLMTFEMLTARMPYELSGVRGSWSAAAIAARLPLEGAPAARFGTFIARCVSRAPEQRYANASAALSDFEQRCARAAG